MKISDNLILKIYYYYYDALTKKDYTGRGQKKKICDTNPLVVVVKRGKNGEISKKV